MQQFIEKYLFGVFSRRKHHLQIFRFQNGEKWKYQYPDTNQRPIQLECRWYRCAQHWNKNSKWFISLIYSLFSCLFSCLGHGQTSDTLKTIAIVFLEFQLPAISRDTHLIQFISETFDWLHLSNRDFFDYFWFRVFHSRFINWMADRWIGRSVGRSMFVIVQ